MGYFLALVILAFSGYVPSVAFKAVKRYHPELSNRIETNGILYAVLYSALPVGVFALFYYYGIYRDRSVALIAICSVFVASYLEAAKRRKMNS